MLAAVESTLCKVEELVNLTVPVTALADFDRLPEAQASTAMKDTPAAFRLSTGEILINDRTFRLLDGREQRAMIAHETAHAFLKKTGRSLPFGEDVEADILACRWGFTEELAALRRKDFQAWADCLERLEVDGENATRECLNRLHTLHTAGIL